MLNWLKDKKNLLLVTHVAPDGDALGSVWGLAWILEGLGKKVKMFVQEIPDNYAPFAHPDTIVDEDVCLDNIDGIVCLDCANVERLFAPFGDWKNHPNVPILNIDHHAANEGYGDENMVFSDAAATCQIIDEFLRFENIIDSKAATALYMGLLTDTGGFRFSNTSSDLLTCASGLLAIGGRHDAVVESLYFSKPQGQVNFESYIMSHARYEYDGKLIFGLMSMSDFKKFDVKSSQMEESTAKLREVLGVKVAVRLIECEDGIRISFRSKDKAIDVAKVANQFNGGGHAMAAGAYIESASLSQAMAQITGAFKEIL